MHPCTGHRTDLFSRRQRLRGALLLLQLLTRAGTGQLADTREVQVSVNPTPASHPKMVHTRLGYGDLEAPFNGPAAEQQYRRKASLHARRCERRGSGLVWSGASPRCDERLLGSTPLRAPECGILRTRWGVCVLGTASTSSKLRTLLLLSQKQIPTTRPRRGRADHVVVDLSALAGYAGTKPPGQQDSQDSVSRCSSPKSTSPSWLRSP